MTGAMYPANKTPLNRYIQHLCASFHLLILSNNIKKKKNISSSSKQSPMGKQDKYQQSWCARGGHPHSTRARTSTSIPAWGSLQGCCSSPLALSSGQQWALGSFCPGAGGRCVQLRAGRARLDPVHWDMLPVLRDFLVLPQEELVLWDTEGHQGTDMGGVLRPGPCSPSSLLPLLPCRGQGCVPAALPCWQLWVSAACHNPSLSSEQAAVKYQSELLQNNHGSPSGHRGCCSSPRAPGSRGSDCGKASEDSRGRAAHAGPSWAKTAPSCSRCRGMHFSWPFLVCRIHPPCDRKGHGEESRDPFLTENQAR